jgi:hypothetical protein
VKDALDETDLAAKTGVAIPESSPYSVAELLDSDLSTLRSLFISADD